MDALALVSAAKYSLYSRPKLGGDMDAIAPPSCYTLSRTLASVL